MKKTPAPKPMPIEQKKPKKKDDKNWAPAPWKPDDKKAWGGGPKAEWKNHAAAVSNASSSSSSWRGSQWDATNDWTLAKREDPQPWEKSLNCNYFSVYSQESHVFDFVFGDVL